MKNQNIDSRQNTYAEILSKHMEKSMIFFSLNLENKTINLTLLEPNVQKVKSIDAYKTTNIKINLEHMNFVEKISLHR